MQVTCREQGQAGGAQERCAPPSSRLRGQPLGVACTSADIPGGSLTHLSLSSKVSQGLAQVSGSPATLPS